MAILVKSIIPSKYAENSQTTQYTATGCKARLDKFTATNVTGTAATLSVNLVASGGTAGANNKIISTRTIAAGESYVCTPLMGQVLEAGGFISVIAGTASAVVISCAGVEIT